MDLLPPFRSLIFVQNDFIGEFLYAPLQHYSFSRLSRAYFCPVCGEVWARVLIADSPFYVFDSHCRQHSSIDLGGGSLIDHNAVSHLVDAWPLSVWERELKMWAEQVIDWTVFRGNMAP